MNPVTLVWLWRELPPDLEGDDLQGFSNEENIKFEILDMVFAMRSFENMNKEMLKNGYWVMHVKWASSTWQTDIINTAAKQKGEEEGVEDQSEIRSAVRRSLNISQK
jgi:hypothetical protein